ncbi:lipase [Clostridium botulinum]|uniref:triacylglycerol lipase n=3 Tax=Clostridium botulinum TaxID=1491 RepID=A0A0C2NTW0_CLOBO|nr:MULTISPECIES: lipase [Clostridium]ACD51115.1 putative lipase [Clostridium botulinum E3 str. Alaska E43]AJF30876.1 lipase [Clostridium botulinum]AJF33939.1 lipase [Clostridium botulinum]KAI3348984.1 lipase [Clostridium botulinum]KIL08114.1 lipase [Clostridium botulinum]
MKKSLTKILGISLLAAAMTVTSFPTSVNAAGITEDSSSILTESVQAIEAEEPIESPDTFNLESASQSNDYPVVLVHGFMGWGRDEVAGFKYWGGAIDLQEKMRDQGYEVYTATVAPASSNWDRACELYAYIVGGKVDYGAAHAEKYGHARYGRSYPGLYNKISDKNKIHLVGHSMGGQTVRTITQLLSEGSDEERNYSQNNLSPLFKGGNDWIRSVTTIATPNDGTTAADANPVVDFVSPLFGVLGSATGHNSLIQNVFDFKLDQWGLTKKDNESQLHYLGRVLSSDIWSGTKDIGTYDLTTYGAEELNKWVKAQPNVYYFSWTACGTKESLLTGHSIPQPGVMNLMFYKNTLAMGKYTRNENGKPIINKDWWPNDGYVNCISENGPKLGSDDVIIDYNGNPQIGKWNAMPTLINVDHEDIIGRFANVQGWYLNLCKQLSSLPENN